MKSTEQQLHSNPDQRHEASNVQRKDAAIKKWWKQGSSVKWEWRVMRCRYSPRFTVKLRAGPRRRPDLHCGNICALPPVTCIRCCQRSGQFKPTQTERHVHNVNMNVFKLNTITQFYTCWQKNNSNLLKLLEMMNLLVWARTQMRSRKTDSPMFLSLTGRCVCSLLDSGVSDVAAGPGSACCLLVLCSCWRVSGWMLREL